MKNIILILTTLAFYSFCDAQIKMNSSGNVALGTDPSSAYKLQVIGTPSLGSYFIGPVTINPNNSGYRIKISTYNSSHPQIIPSYGNNGYVGSSPFPFYQFWSSDGYVHTSDGRQKENVRNIAGALNTLLQLQGVKYDVKKEYAYIDSLVKDTKQKEKLEADRKDKIGFIAQDVYKLFPEVVVYDDSADIYGIQYDRMVPLLVEAIKEQQVIIESLQAEIKSSKLKSTAQSSVDEDEGNNECLLYQNVPNPFSESTRIEYYITDKVENASVYIYDMNGTQLKNIPVHLKGYGNVTLYGSELKAGMYMYSLIADGQLIGTRQMILTD